MSSYDSFNPTMSLRQRRPTATDRESGQQIPISDENTDPNCSNSWKRSGQTKLDVPAPPRTSLVMAPKPSFGATRNNAAAPSFSSLDPISPSKDRVKSLRGNESSLWIVAYGFRTEPQYRALVDRLESCGAVTTRKGGLLVTADVGARRRKSDHNGSGGRGDEKECDGDDGKNWVALRFENVLAARKALCQHGAMLDVGGGGTIVVGVMQLEDSGAARRFGIDMGEAFAGGALSSQQLGRALSQPDMEDADQRSHRLMNEEDILIHGGEGTMVGDKKIDTYYEDPTFKSGLDSLCGKVLAVLFNWEDPN